MKHGIVDVAMQTMITFLYRDHSTLIISNEKSGVLMIINQSGNWSGSLKARVRV